MKKKEIEQYIKRTGHNSSVTVQQYTEGIKELFRKWKAAVNTEGTPFITDGVMDPEKWFAQAERPLFLLKEAYGGDDDWDLAAEYISDSLTGKPLPPIWRRISRWAYGMLTKEYKLSGKYHPDAAEFHVRGNPYLRGIAAINIKKYFGKNTSDYKEIEEYAVKDAEYLREQIKLCDPTVIVCGYTATALDWLFDFGRVERRNPEWYYHFELNGHEVLVIDYYHPSNHYPELMNYFTLMMIYDHAKADQYLRLKADQYLRLCDETRK